MRRFFLVSQKEQCLEDEVKYIIIGIWNMTFLRLFRGFAVVSVLCWAGMNEMPRYNLCQCSAKSELFAFRVIYKCQSFQEPLLRKYCTIYLTCSQ